MKALGILEEVKDMCTVWTHEALDFTPWLSQDDNMDILADAFGLETAETEQVCCSGG